ncbi:hypothetical protein EVAR_54712_1 [Eumeta japonica]|uniref:Uncharacterized protein n=1 Tax=Eumeta variegata TaxID=151549 RepID=A0A4C1YQB6_EUMVA|nr:hypothetical protein EVAR_54712_1 [Eumeta japonica]
MHLITDFRESTTHTIRVFWTIHFPNSCARRSPQIWHRVLRFVFALTHSKAEATLKPGKEIDASQTERLGRSCLSVSCSALSLARSAQAERDNESCFFVRASGVHRFIRRQKI